MTGGGREGSEERDSKEERTKEQTMNEMNEQQIKMEERGPYWEQKGKKKSLHVHVSEERNKTKK